MLAHADVIEVYRHQCPWCRSLAVEIVLDLDAGVTDDQPGLGRCTTCGNDAPLVPSGFTC